MMPFVLEGFMEDLYSDPAIASTVNMHQIKSGYWMSMNLHGPLNPKNRVPMNSEPFHPKVCCGLAVTHVAHLSLAILCECHHLSVRKFVQCCLFLLALAALSTQGQASLQLSAVSYHFFSSTTLDSMGICSWPSAQCVAFSLQYAV